jgi:hypothetical protein
MSDAKDGADDPNLLTAAELDALRQVMEESAKEIDELLEADKEGNNQ